MSDKLKFKEAQARIRRLVSRKKKNEKLERTCSKINTYLGGTRSTESWKILKKYEKIQY